MGVTELGRTGLRVGALNSVRSFDERVLRIADGEHGIVFLSARPGLEQHELILQHDRTALRGTTLTHQTSPGCPYASACSTVRPGAEPQTVQPGRADSRQVPPARPQPGRAPWRSPCTRCWPAASAPDPASCWARSPT